MQNKAYYEANRERVLASQRAAYAVNPEKYKIRSQAYQVACPEKVRAQKKAHYAANSEKVRARVKAWQTANPEKYQASQKAQRARKAANPEKQRAYRKIWFMTHPERQRAKTLKRHGITPETYQVMLAAQDGVCAICQKSEKVKQHLAVDHDHETGAVRGLLCRDCNTSLGKFGDSPELLRRAAAYLEKEFSGTSELTTKTTKPKTK